MVDQDSNRTENPKRIVRDGYDLISSAYRSDNFEYEGSEYASWLSLLVPRLAPHSKVLDLGCGCGLPVAKTLAEQFDVTGVDFSAVQIQRARELVPDAQFVLSDITEVDFEPGSLDAVISFYTFIHLPLAEQRPLLKSICRWLRMDGYLLSTFGENRWTGTESDWLGVTGATMWWSHTDSSTYRDWLDRLGFEILSSRFIPEGEGGHRLFLSTKRPQSDPED